MFIYSNKRTFGYLLKGLTHDYSTSLVKSNQYSNLIPVKEAYFPYGISSWEGIVSTNRFYVDKTEAISQMEDTGDYLKLWRPRRFGKTLFCNQLAHYYDILKSGKEEDFKRLFGNTFIGENPTINRGKYMVLSLSFNEVGDNHVEKSFNNNINSAIMAFSKYYNKAGLLEVPIEINPSDAMDSFKMMLGAVKQSKYELYLIVDEYDSFANRLLLNIDTTVDDIGLKQYSHLISTNESILRNFGNMVKSGSSDAIARMFFTGITPMAFCDAFSGLNMVEDISSRLIFSSTFGLTENDLKIALSKLTFSQEEQSKHLITLRSHLNGYRFNSCQENGVYNPQACFYYLKHLVGTGEAPNPILDTNIASASDNVIEFLVRHRFAETVLENDLNSNWKDFIFGSLSSHEVKYNIRSADLFDKDLSSVTLLSLAYHHGYLTYSKDINQFKLVCPNLELKRILMEALSRGNKSARSIINDIIKEEEISNKSNRNKLFDNLMKLIEIVPKAIKELV